MEDDKDIVEFRIAVEYLDSNKIKENPARNNLCIS